MNPGQSRRTERLINLLFVLMAASRPVPREALRRSIVDYRDSTTDEAFERMFERDKEELRSMGVPIESFAGDGPGGIDGYRVKGKDYELANIDLDNEEMALLALAASVWERATLSDAARTALVKLEAIGAHVDSDALTLVARIRDPEPAFAPLLSAIDSRRVVAFAYRKADATEASSRRVQPWGLVARRGNWYLVGHDLGREAPRVFRLSRITTAVSATGPEHSYDIPAHDLDEMVDPPHVEDPITVSVRVRPGSAVSLRRRATSVLPGEAWDAVELTVPDVRRIAAELAGHGPDVVVDSPAAVRDLVLSSLRASASLIGEADGR